MAFWNDLWQGFLNWGGPDSLPQTPQPPPPRPPIPNPVPPNPDIMVAQLLGMHNDARVEYGRPGLTLNDKLCNDAMAHSHWMALNRNMSHEEVPGTQGYTATDFASRIKAVGYLPQKAAENVAAGQRSVSEVMHAWMNSPGHLANILDPGLWNVGFGYAQDEHQNIYWTAVFATPFRGHRSPGQTIIVNVSLPPAIVRKD